MVVRSEKLPEPIANFIPLKRAHKANSTMPVVVHLWGIDGKPSVISPESLALYWFLNGFYVEQEKVVIVFSNNTDLSPNAELPLLIDGEVKVCSYPDIVGYLSSKDDLLETALLQFTATRISTLTQYQLYLNKHNYESFTRKIFSHLLYWPLWYNTPLHYRRVAREKCASLAYIKNEDDEEYTDEGLANTSDLVQSKVLRIAQAQKSRQKELLEQAKCNLQYLNKLDDALEKWNKVRTELDESINATDLLLLANIYVQLELPDGDHIRKHLKDKFGDAFYQRINSQLSSVAELTPNVKQRPPTFQESGNAVMSLYYFTRRFV